MRKSEGESQPDAHFDNDIEAPSDTKLIHTASLTSNSPTHILTDSLSDILPHSLPIEFHTAIDICFEIYLQIISNTDDIVITHSCFTTCASTSNHEVS